MPKILFISNTANFQKFNLPFMRWCIQQGWQVDYASMGEEPIKECSNSFTISITRTPFSIKNLFGYFELKKIIKKNEYDIIHCHTPMGGCLGRLAAKELWKKNKVKIIYTAHGFHFYKGAPLFNWLVYYPIEKILSKYTDVSIVINEEDFQLTQKKKFRAKQVVKFDGVGVNLERFKPIS